MSGEATSRAAAIRSAAAGAALRAACAVAVAAIAAAAAADHPARDEALWRIVEAGCGGGVAGGAAATEVGLSCDRARGFAVLKDRCGPTHFLLLPIARRAGIESAELQRADEPNYFALAWAQRRVVATAAAEAGRGDDDIGLAINSRFSRTQSQLHIHLDWIRPEVRAALRAAAEPGPLPSMLTLAGHRFRLFHVAALEPSPFRLVAEADGDRDDASRARETIAVIADGAGGFYVLGGRTDFARLDSGHAEDLLIPRHCR